MRIVHLPLWKFAVVGLTFNLIACAGSFQETTSPVEFKDVYPACKYWPPITSASTQSQEAAPNPTAASPPATGESRPPTSNPPAGAAAAPDRAASPSPASPGSQNTQATICAAYITKAAIDQCVYHSYQTATSGRWRNGVTAVLMVGAVAAAPIALATGATATTTALLATSTTGASFALPSIQTLLPSQSQVSIDAMYKAEKDYLSIAALKDDTEFRNLWDAVGSACPPGVLKAN